MKSLPLKMLVKYSGLKEVGIPSLLLGLRRSLAALAPAKQTVGFKIKNSNIREDARELHRRSVTLVSIMLKQL